jgi:hypothetical protein
MLNFSRFARWFVVGRDFSEQGCELDTVRYRVHELTHGAFNGTITGTVNKVLVVKIYLLVDKKKVFDLLHGIFGPGAVGVATLGIANALVMINLKR